MAAFGSASQSCSGVPGGDDTQRIGQGTLPISAGIEPQHGTLGVFAGILIGAAAHGKAPGVGQDGVIQQAGQIVFLGGQVALVQVALEGHPHQVLAGIGAVFRQHIGQFAAAEQPVGGAVGHIVPFLRDRAVDAVQRACQCIRGILPVGSQHRYGIAAGTVQGRSKDGSGGQTLGLCLGQSAVGTVQGDSGGFRLRQPVLQRLHKVAPFVPAGILQGFGGTIPQQTVQQAAAGPVAVQAAAGRQSGGTVGNIGAGRRSGQQRVRGDIHQIALRLVIQGQQIRRSGILGPVQGHALGIGIGLHRRGQTFHGIRIQGPGLRRGGGLHRGGALGRGGSTGCQQQRRECQRCRGKCFTHRFQYLPGIR